MMLTIILLSFVITISGYTKYHRSYDKYQLYREKMNLCRRYSDDNNDLGNEVELYQSKNELLEQGIKLIRAKLYDTINENVQLKTQLSNTIINNNDDKDKKLILTLENELRLSLMKINTLQLKLDNEINIKRDLSNSYNNLAKSNKELSNEIDNISDEVDAYKSEVDTYKAKLKILQKAYENNSIELKISKDKYRELERQYNNVIASNEKNDIVGTINEFMLAFKQQTRELQETQKSIQNVEKQFLDGIQKFEGEYSQSSAVFNYMIAGDLRDQRRILDQQTSLIQNIVSQLNTELPVMKSTTASTESTLYLAEASSESSRISKSSTITSTPSTSPQENEFINDRILKTTKNLGANLKIKKRVTKVARTVIDAVSFLFAKGPYYETLSSPDFNNPAQDSKINQQKPDSWSKLIIDTNEYDIDSYERNNI